MFLCHLVIRAIDVSNSILTTFLFKYIYELTDGTKENTFTLFSFVLKIKFHLYTVLVIIYLHIFSHVVFRINKKIDYNSVFCILKLSPN